METSAICIGRVVHFTDMATFTFTALDVTKHTTVADIRDFIFQSFLSSKKRTGYKPIHAMFTMDPERQRRLPMSLPYILIAFTSWFNRLDAYAYRAEWKRLSEKEARAEFPKLQDFIDSAPSHTEFVKVSYLPGLNAQETIELELELDEPAPADEDLGK